MARAPVAPIQSEGVRPVASPSDTYIRPEASQLGQLAQALEPLDQGLRQIGAQRSKKKNDEDAVRGEAAFYKNNQEGYDEATRSGAIPAQESPAFMKAYKGAQGNVAGVQLTNDFNTAYSQWEGRTSEDPAAFQKFTEDFVKSRLGTDDPAVLETIMPHIKALVANGYSQHTSDVSAAVIERSKIAHVAGGAQAIEADAETAKNADGEPDFSRAMAAIDDQRARYIKSGRTGEEFDATMAESVAVKAKTMGGEQGRKLIEAYFDRNVPGQAYTYASTPDGVKLKTNALEGIEVGDRQKAAADYTAQERADKQGKEDATREALDIVLKDPDAPIPEELLARGSKYDATFKARVLEWREAGNKAQSNPAVLKEVYTDIITSNDPVGVVKDMVRRGNLPFADISSAMTFAKSVETAKPKVDETLQGASAKSLLDAMDIATKGKNADDDPIAGISPEGLEAQYDFKRMVNEWTIANPNASVLEREEALGKMGKTILDRITPGEDYKAGTYDAGKDRNPNNPYTPEAAAPETQGPPQPTSSQKLGLPAKPSAEDLGSLGAKSLDAQEEKASSNITPEQQTFYEGLEPDKQAMVQAYADKKGIPLAKAIDSVQKLMAPKDKNGAIKPEDGKAKPISYNPGEDEQELDRLDTSHGVGLSQERAQSILEQALKAGDTVLKVGGASVKDDPTAANLLDFISEDESAGKYNAIFGNINNKVDLGQFSVDEIMQRQAAAVRGGQPSSAVGRYQFIRKTLRSLKDELGLSGSEKFTPELQDQLGLALLERRGYSDWKAGKLSQRQFAFRLSQEWASLPNPSTGRSFYAGDGLNASRKSTREVYSALGLASSAEPASPIMASYAPEAPLEQAAPASAGNVYANIPETEREQFTQWNSDPVANHETNLASIDQTLAGVIRRAQQLSGVKFVLGSGKRDPELQKKAVKWGWSKTEDSDHLHGGAADLWGLDANGAVTFDPTTSKAIVKAMKKAAKEMGVELDVGADWKKFKDNPHFAIKGQKA